MPNSIDLVDEVTGVVRELDRATARWAADQHRPSASEAVGHSDRAMVLLHRVRDELVREAQAWDQQHRPHDPRD